MSECARDVTNNREHWVCSHLPATCRRWRFGQGLQVSELGMDKTQWVDLGHSSLHQLWHLYLDFMRRREKTGHYIIPSSPGNGILGCMSRGCTHERAEGISGAQVKNAAAVNPS